MSSLRCWRHQHPHLLLHPYLSVSGPRRWVGEGGIGLVVPAFSHNVLSQTMTPKEASSHPIPPPKKVRAGVDGQILKCSR